MVKVAPLPHDISQRQEGRQAFKDLPSEHRRTVIEKWMQAAQPPPWIEKMFELRFLATENGNKLLGKKSTNSVLMTWNLECKGESDAARIAQSLPPEQLTVAEVTTRLRKDATAIRLWHKVADHGQTCKKLAGASDVAICLELCPETYELQKSLRLHVHMFLRAQTGVLSIRNISFFSFQGLMTHVSSSIGGLASTKNRNDWSGFFYCCLKDKKGTVFCESTKTPFTKFLVNPNWIMSLVQAQKLKTHEARKLLVQCVNASRHLKDLDNYDVEQEKIAVQQAMAGAECVLTQNLKKQKVFAEAEAFVRQFEQPLHRYKFLVLAGPSRVGKTAFARSLCEEGLEVLEVNCAGGTEPNLRAYRLTRHGLILFDEIVAEQVAAQRKLFQAQAAPVQLGCSATNCYSYEVFNWRKRLVLASNNWHTSLLELSPGDQEWIKSNSIVLDITEQMWVD